MPIYEYFCSQCEQAIEVLQKINEAAPSNCPKCDYPSMKKMVSAAAFRLKGQGWYETDYKTGPKKNNLFQADEPKPKSSELDLKMKKDPASTKARSKTLNKESNHD